MNSTSSTWETLFSGAACEEIDQRAFYVLKRQGQELLAVPADRRIGSKMLELYLPQTSKARFAKRVFRLLLASPLRCLLPRRKVCLRRTEFSEFLNTLNDGRIPSFGVLSGNPAEPGRRFIFGLLDDGGCCRRIVKCAGDAAGRGLIEREAAVLGEINGGFPSIPKLEATLSISGCSAFSMEFLGEPDRAPTRSERVDLVGRWIHSGPEVPLESLTPWCAVATPNMDARGVMVRPVVFHGDFAPWNIRRHQQDWMVIDWENASFHGPPLWDLLHYEIHEEILVRRAGFKRVRERIHQLLGSRKTAEYLQHCGASKHQELLLRGYFMHLDRIYPRIRGRETVDALMKSFEVAAA